MEDTLCIGGVFILPQNIVFFKYIALAIVNIKCYNIFVYLYTFVICIFSVSFSHTITENFFKIGGILYERKRRKENK